MKVSKHFFLFVLLLSASSVALADAEYCPEGHYNVHLRYVAFREKDGYVTFSPKENDGKLQNYKEYWLSNYKVDSDWGKAAYATGLAALMAGSRVWITCDGKTPKIISTFSE